jgi:hypothetical protein
VAESREALAAALDHVAGGVEFGVRIVEPAPTDGPLAASAAADAAEPRPLGGRAYLRALAEVHGQRRERLRRRDRVLGALREEVGGLAREERVHDIAAPGLVSVAHLVARSDEARYHQVVRHFSRRRPELGIHVTGPWPPYSFTS